MFPTTLPSASFALQTPPPLDMPLTFGTGISDVDIEEASLSTKRASDTVFYERPQGRLAPRKKSRLRLQFVTSPLSEPYSAPASYNVNRGSCRVATWAKYRPLNRSWLRKRAILNSVNRSLGSDQEASAAFGSQYDAVDGNIIFGSTATEMDSTFPNKQSDLNGQGSSRLAGTFGPFQSSKDSSPSTVYSSGYNYNALDEDYNAKYRHEDEEQDEADYVPHPDFASTKLSQDVSTFKSPLPSPSPSPPAYPLSILPAGYHPGYRPEAVPAPEPISPLYIQPDASFEDRMRSWLQADKRPPSPPEEQMLTMLLDQDSIFGLR